MNSPRRIPTAASSLARFVLAGTLRRRAYAQSVKERLLLLISAARSATSASRRSSSSFPGTRRSLPKPNSLLASACAARAASDPA
ncbi:MAG: hypothetical protein ACK55Z_33620, partial [bacterium]